MLEHICLTQMRCQVPIVLQTIYNMDILFIPLGKCIILWGVLLILCTQCVFMGYILQTIIFRSWILITDLQLLPQTRIPEMEQDIVRTPIMIQPLGPMLR